MKQPKNLRCYDNGGETMDRYTVVYMDFPERSANTYMALGMSENPFHGIGQHTSAMPGKHLGKRICFQDLPGECQRAVLQDFQDEPT